MKDEKKAPKLRFKGFTDDWEQCKLGDVAKINSGKDYKGLQPGKIPVYGTGGYMLSVNDKLSDIDAIGIGRKGTIDKPYYLNAPFWTVDTLFYVTPRGTVDISFMFPLFKNINWKRYDESTGVPSLSKNTIKKIRVSFPQNNEQVKIGDLFQKITQIITLHEEKKRQLERLKSALLQKMFPKNGAKVPELRFAGFADDWEERKFESLLDKNEGVRRGPFGSALKKDLFVKESPYVVYEQQNAIYDNYETRYNISKEKFEELHKFELIADDFIMSGAGTIGRISKVPKGIKKGVFNQALIRFRINKELTDSEYFLQFIRTDFMQRKLTGANPGSAITNLVPMSDVKKWKIKVPIKEEQEKIGSFFQQLDETIALHQRKLDLLKEQKKGFLQKMFV
ncbi:restriction endonuclease subunit S [Lactobacillus delbrueckii subsp. bulgaricus]|nr:restriction endonuclease subunit S [Lactobacillus delbrueckii subsp. bulgaricus]